MRTSFPLALEHSLRKPQVVGWKGDTDGANMSEIQKGGNQALALLLGNSTYSHCKVWQGFQSNVDLGVDAWAVANSFLLDFAARAKHDWAQEEIAEVNACIQSASCGQNWLPDSFRFVRKLQDAKRNHGTVDLMQSMIEGSFVAVKRMPRAWTGTGFKDKCTAKCEEVENPWLDVGLSKYLHKHGVPFACEPLGVFFSSSETFVVSSLATEGDLFDFSSGGPPPSKERETQLRPVFQQIFYAVCWLHDRFIAHCDISMENILLSKDCHDGPLQVKLIDYGMASVGERLTVVRRGKPSYQAPEMFEGAFDPFQADAFALGVVLYSSASTLYPWMNTQPGGCQMFALAYDKGLDAVLRRQKISRQHGRTALFEVLSQNIVHLLRGLLAVNPRDRLAPQKAKQLDWLN